MHRWHREFLSANQFMFHASHVPNQVGYFFLVDFPDRASKTAWKFLTENECQFIMRRVARDRDDAFVEPFSLKKWASSGLDLKIWGFAMIYLCLTTIAYAIAYFLPIILREGMGFSIAASQCLVAPPYIFAGILMYAGAWFGDKYHLRGPVLVFNCIVCLIGLPIMVSQDVLPPLRSCQFSKPGQTMLTSPLGLSFQQWRPLLWRFPCDGRCKRQHPHRHGLPSEQYPRSMETCLLQCHPCRLRRYWRYRRLPSVPQSGRTALSPWPVGVYDLQWSHHPHCRHLDCLLQGVQ